MSHCIRDNIGCQNKLYVEDILQCDQKAYSITIQQKQPSMKSMQRVIQTTQRVVHPIPTPSAILFILSASLEAVSAPCLSPRGKKILCYEYQTASRNLPETCRLQCRPRYIDLFSYCICAKCGHYIGLISLFTTNTLVRQPEQTDSVSAYNLSVIHNYISRHCQIKTISLVILSKTSILKGITPPPISDWLQRMTFRLDQYIGLNTKRGQCIGLNSDGVMFHDCGMIHQLFSHLISLSMYEFGR